MAKSPNLSIIISQEDKERLKRLAVAEKRSVSQLAAFAIQEYLDKAEAAKSPAKQKQEAAPVNPRQPRSVASLKLDDLEQG